jgi:hypothetical protein
VRTVVVSGNVRVLFAMITDLGCAGPLKVTIGSHPDEVLLEIFTFCAKEAYEEGLDCSGAHV